MFWTRKKTQNNNVKNTFIQWPAHFSVMCNKDYCEYINGPKPIPGKYNCCGIGCTGTYKISKSSAREAEEFLRSEMRTIVQRRRQVALAKERVAARQRPLQDRQNYREQEQYRHQHRHEYQLDPDFVSKNDCLFRSHSRVDRDGLFRKPAQRRTAKPSTLDIPCHPRIERYFARHGWPQGERPVLRTVQAHDGPRTPIIWF